MIFNDDNDFKYLKNLKTVIKIVIKKIVIKKINYLRKQHYDDRYWDYKVNIMMLAAVRAVKY